MQPSYHLIRWSRENVRAREKRWKGKERKTITRVKSGIFTGVEGVTYRSPGIFGVPGHIDPTSRYGTGFSPGWRAEACRFDHGDRSRSGFCKESVNRCLDTYVRMHYKRADLAVPSTVRSSSTVLHSALCSYWKRYSANSSSNNSMCISISVVIGNSFITRE